jgi:hypothetical protein
MRRRNSKKLGIYDPPDPSPRVLPDDARAQWEAAYEGGLAAYNDKETAKATAWRTVEMSWSETSRGRWNRCKNGRCELWPQPRVLPHPGNLTWLGVLVEYAWVDYNGELQIRAFKQDPPDLYWDKTNKWMISAPNAPHPGCNPITPDLARQLRDAIETYETWHARAPECTDQVRIPAVQLHAMGPSDSVSYRSDKWHDRDHDPEVRKAQEYIHKHWKDVWTWQDVDDDGRPNVILVYGGAFDLHERGLIH